MRLPVQLSYRNRLSRPSPEVTRISFYIDLVNSGSVAGVTTIDLRLHTPRVRRRRSLGNWSRIKIAFGKLT